MQTTHPPLDVVILGAGAAGASAALVLGRARAHVLLIDDGRPANAPSAGIGGFLGNDGTPPADFRARADEDLAAYPTITRHRATAESVRPGSERRWEVVADGMAIETDRVLLAVGMRYAVPPIQGFADLWGGDVFHCPFCHGWEHRDQALVVLGGPMMTMERALLLRRWSDRVTLVTGEAVLSGEERATLAGAGVTVVDGEVVAVDAPDGGLERLVLADGTTVEAEGLMVPAPHEVREPRLVADLGLATDATGHVTVDAFGRTSAPGIWAAGDLTSPMASVARAVGEGSTCAAAITHDLVLSAHAIGGS